MKFLPTPAFLISSVLLLSSASLAESAEAGKSSKRTNNEFRVCLTDGSSLICKLQITEAPLKTSYAELKVPTHKLKNFSINHEDEQVTIKVLNGDIIRGKCPLKEIVVDSLLGELTISLKHVEEITTTLEKEPVYEDSPARKNACINNLRMIDAAKEQWALETNARQGDVVNTNRANNYIRGNKTPICPAGGTYNYKTIGENPECSVPGHELTRR